MSNGQIDEVSNLVVISRRVIVVVDKHSGAWKIAYADFVTALMAFFLLLWLLNAATGSQALGIGDYFSDSVDESSTSNLSHILEGLTFDADNVLSSISGTPSITTDTPNLGGEERGQREGKSRSVKDLENFYQSNLPDSDIPNIEELGQGSGLILSLLNDNPHLQARKKSFTVEDTPDGSRLHILVPGLDNIFEGRFSATMSDEVKRELAVVLSMLTKIDNDIIISGHTDSLPDWSPAVDKWDLSIQRAYSVFKWLTFLGFDQERVIRIEGLASTSKLRLPEGSSLLQENHVSIFIIENKDNFKKTMFDRGKTLYEET